MPLQTTGVLDFAVTSAARAKARAENPWPRRRSQPSSPVLLIHGRDDTVIPAEFWILPRCSWPCPPGPAPVVPARLCLRGGFRCFNRIARVMGFDIPDEPAPGAGTSLTYEQFLEAVARMREVGFPIERDPAEAWPDFVGWRVNYEEAAYAVAAEVYAVPALWSGPRRHSSPPIPPRRPAPGRPPK